MSARLNMRRQPAPRQQGAVLVVALLFLLIITMLGVTTMQSTSSEERMAGNVRDWTNALHAAEAAIRDARNDLKGNCTPGAATCLQRAPLVSGATGFGDASATAGTCSTTGICMPQTAVAISGQPSTYPQLNLANWTATGSTALNPVTIGTYTQPGGATTNPFPRAARQPQYIVEALCTPTAGASLGGVVCPNYLYRVTARGFGGNVNTQVTLQAVIAAD
ncbi:MAG: PilX N-terminal domain-containing pilus assembly protein [Burkholderiales bacterium]